jgi:hypothetical protein
MKTGTCHFPTVHDARDYYRTYGFKPDDVSSKIESGEIHIGPPKTREGQRAYIDEGERRYFIEE